MGKLHGFYGFHPRANMALGNSLLVGALKYDFYDGKEYEIIIPTDELIFFRGVAQPPTRL